MSARSQRRQAEFQLQPIFDGFNLRGDRAPEIRTLAIERPFPGPAKFQDPGVLGVAVFVRAGNFPDLLVITRPGNDGSEWPLRRIHT